jgi:hypothetical protein
VRKSARNLLSAFAAEDLLLPKTSSAESACDPTEHLDPLREPYVFQGLSYGKGQNRRRCLGGRAARLYFYGVGESADCRIIPSFQHDVFWEAQRRSKKPSVQVSRGLLKVFSCPYLTRRF